MDYFNSLLGRHTLIAVLVVSASLTLLAGHAYLYGQDKSDFPDGYDAVQAAPGFKIHGVSQKPVFSPDGRLAYMQGKDELTLPGPNGSPITLHLRGISVWRVDSDGQWRCVIDVSNEEPSTRPSS